MNNKKTLVVFAAQILTVCTSASAADDWVIDTQDDWVAATAEQSNLQVKDGVAIPSDKVATFASKVQRFDQKRQATSIVLDQCTDWTEVKETYDFCQVLSKHVNKTPAKVDLKDLPAGHGFGFEMRMTDTTENKSKPMMDRVTLTSQD